MKGGLCNTFLFLVLSLTKIYIPLDIIKTRPSQIHLLGKSPKKIGSLIKRNNPYEQILKTSALSVGASCFNGDADTWVNGTFTNWQEYLLQNQNKLIKNSNDADNNVRYAQSAQYTPGSFERQYQKYSVENLNQLTPEKDAPTSTTDRTQQLISSRLSLPDHSGSEK